MSEKSLAHHHKVLKQFLDISDDRNSKPKPSSRKLQKLLKLSDGQFKELSTDVYDELRRRIDESRGEPDYLLPKSSFHPMRNQARQKLSSLPQNRFKDLVGDIAYEIERRKLHIEPEIEPEKELELEPESEPEPEPEEVPLYPHEPVEQQKSIPVAPYPQERDLNGEFSKESTNEYSNVNGDLSREIASEHEESNVSKSSDVLNQSIGISSKTVVPTKATLTWSSDEEDNDDNDEINKSRGIDDAANDTFVDREDQKSLEQLNGSVDHQSTISDLAKKLEDRNMEYDQLKQNLERVQQELDETLDKNYNLTKEKADWDTSKSNWDTSKSDYESKIRNLQDKTEYNDLLKEFEQMKSSTAALRLENQSLKNSANAFSRDHSRSNSTGNSLSRELSTTGNINESRGSKNGLSSQMNLILEKLTSLDAPPMTEKKPSFVQLRNDVINWQQKYEDLKAGKLIKEFNTNLISQNQLKGFVNSDGLIPIDLVSQLHSISETFLVYLDGKDFNSDILFNKISKLSIVANEIANAADGNHLNSNDLAVQLRDCTSHLLTVTRYYTIYSSILPKVVIERAMNDVIFATCEVVGACKITNNKSINSAALSSVQTQQLELKPPALNIRSNNSSAHDLGGEGSEDGTDVGVRPLRMANKLKNGGSNSTSVESFHSSKDLPVGRKFNALASKFERSTDSLNNTITADSPAGTPTKGTPTNGTPTKGANRSNIMDKVKQFESPPQEKPSGNSFILDRSSLEIKKSPNLNKVLNDPNASIGSIGSTSSDVQKPSRTELAQAEANTDAVIDEEESSPRGETVGSGAGAGVLGAAGVGAAVGAVGAGAVGAVGAAARSNSKSKGLFQSIRDRFTDQSPGVESIQEPVENVQKSRERELIPNDDQDASDNGRHGTSVDDMLTSTAETTPSKESVSDVEVSPSKSFQSVRDRLSERAPSVSVSDTTMKESDMPQNQGTESPFDSPTNSPSDSRGQYSTESLVNSSPAKSVKSLGASAPSPVQSPVKPQSRGVSSQSDSADANTEALNSLNGVSKKKVMISEAKPVEIQSRNAASESEEESDFEDEKTAKARERQEYRKSMAAATFNVDLFDIDDPDNTLTQVLLYLEHQTVEVINTIQILLTAIKKPNATRGDLRGKSNAITEVISQMTEATNTSMNQTRNAQLKEHGSWVVKSLEDCHHRMSVLCKPSNDKKDTEFADRSFKQRLAGISFDIAKCTKELVKTVEEASLKEDIANLDARLSYGDDLT